MYDNHRRNSGKSWLERLSLNKDFGTSLNQNEVLG